MLELFNNKYQTYSRVSNLRKQIQGWKQRTYEPLDATMAHYYTLLHRCLGHGYAKWDQLRHIMDGLRNEMRRTLGTYAQGRLFKLRSHEVEILLEQVAQEEGELSKRESAEEYNRNPSLRKKGVKFCDEEDESPLEELVNRKTLLIQKLTTKVSTKVDQIGIC